MAALARVVYQQPPRFWKAYCRALDTRPLVTKVATSVVGFAVGDVIAQYASRPKNAVALGWNFDWARMARMAAFGGAFAGPIGHYWFVFLDKTIMPRTPTVPRAVISKIAADQLLQAPVGTMLFFTFQCLLQSKPEQIVECLDDKFVPTMLASYKLWPLAHAVNFAFVPSSQRVLYINVVSIVWTYILSCQAAASSPKRTDGKTVVWKTVEGKGTVEFTPVQTIIPVEM